MPWFLVIVTVAFVCNSTVKSVWRSIWGGVRAMSDSIELEMVANIVISGGWIELGWVGLWADQLGCRQFITIRGDIISAVVPTIVRTTALKMSPRLRMKRLRPDWPAERTSNPIQLLWVSGYFSLNRLSVSLVVENRCGIWSVIFWSTHPCLQILPRLGSRCTTTCSAIKGYRRFDDVYQVKRAEDRVSFEVIQSAKQLDCPSSDAYSDAEV